MNERLFPFLHTATEYHLGLLKAKLAKYRAQLLEPKSAGAKGEGFDVMKSGDARVALIGFPSVGKVGTQKGLGRRTHPVLTPQGSWKIFKSSKHIPIFGKGLVIICTAHCTRHINM